jgi:hypothetical protein
MALNVSPDEIQRIRSILVDTNGEIAARFRCIFTLKAIGGSEAIDALAEGE